MTKIMMKELNKLIVKDIFNCLSEEDAERLRVLRVEWHIDDEAYERLKAMITSRDVHERIEHARREPNRWIRMARYAAVLILPLCVAIYLLLHEESNPQSQLMARSQVEDKLPIPIRKQPTLVLDDGSVLQLHRANEERKVTSNAITNGNELIYSKKDKTAEGEEVAYNTVVTPKGGEYHVVLADGTKIWFNEETRLKFPVDFVGEVREVFLDRGEIYLNVAKDEEHPFIVHTGNGDVRVLGTEFNVKCLSADRMFTTLVKGSVQVKRADAEVLLHPNQQAEVGNVVNVITVTDVDVEEIICWKDNMFFFKDVELETILEKLAEWYGFTVFYENAEAKQEKFFVRVDKYEEVDKILEVISEVGNVKFKIKGKVVTVYE